MKVAGEYGFPINIEDLPTVESDQDLSDAELEGVSGGYTFPRTDWVYCDNPWTNYWCTLKCCSGVHVTRHRTSVPARMCRSWLAQALGCGYPIKPAT